MAFERLKQMFAETTAKLFTRPL